MFIAVILKNINSLSHRKLTSVSLHLHRERRSVTIPEFSDDDVFGIFGVTDFVGFAHLFVCKNNSRRSTEHYVWGDRIGPLNVVFYFFHFTSLLVSEESEAFS